MDKIYLITAQSNENLMISIRRYILFFCVIFFQHIDLHGQTQPLAIGFYNLENLFDTQDDPEILDEEFLPSGAKNWTNDKYQDKLSRLAKVIRNIQSDLKGTPLAILGVCEIENQGVLEDLVRQDALHDYYFKIVHRNSKDFRGVDVGLLYRSEYFQVLAVKSFEVPLPNNGDTPRKTRDVLLIKGMLAGRLVFITVNHWPSRRGGEKETQAFRNLAASINKNIADSVRIVHPHAGFIVMGDLNDNPDDLSVFKTLGAAKMLPLDSSHCFFNPFYEHYRQGEGTGAHDDRWGLFDQIILSNHFIQSKDYWNLVDQKVFRKNYMIEKSGHYKNYPKRTFSGDKYNFGYSDHFPVYCILRPN